MLIAFRLQAPVGPRTAPIAQITTEIHSVVV
jgi:hypothetical protein